MSELSMYRILNTSIILMCLSYAFCFQRTQNNSQRKTIFWVFVFLYCFILAFRPEHTPDTKGYIEDFLEITAGNFFSFNGHIFQKYHGYEIGFIYFIKVFKIFSNSYRLFFFLCSFLGIVSMTNGLSGLYGFIDSEEQSRLQSVVFQSRDNYYIRNQILAVYIACFGLLYNGISLRAGIAMGFGICSVYYFLNEKRTSGIIMAFVAIIFQRSAIIFFLVFCGIRFLPCIPRRGHFIIWCLFGICMFTELGKRIANPIISYLISFFSKYNITSINYLLDLEDEIGMTDVLMWLIYGYLSIFGLQNSYYKKYLNSILLGAFIVFTMFGIRAISRAWDMCYLVMVPMLVALLNNDSHMLRPIFVQKSLVSVLILIKSIKMISVALH